MADAADWLGYEVNHEVELSMTNKNGLYKAWDELSVAIGSMLTALPQQTTEAAAVLDTKWKAFAAKLQAYGLTTPQMEDTGIPVVVAPSDTPPDCYVCCQPVTGNPVKHVFTPRDGLQPVHYWCAEWV